MHTTYQQRKAQRATDARIARFWSHVDRIAILAAYVVVLPLAVAGAAMLAAYVAGVPV